MPTIGTPKTFTAAWIKKFTEVVEVAAGKDGRLSLTEARRIAERTDGGQFMADNAVNYLLAKGQKSVSKQKLIDAAASYVLAKTTAAAGPDGRLSLADGKTKLPADLKDDFLSLRGLLPAGPQRSAEQLRRDVREQVLRALDSGGMVKLSGPPAIVRGRQPTVEHATHEPTNTSYEAWGAEGNVYVSRGASGPPPHPEVGWYKLGPVAPAGTGRAELRASFDSATKDLWLMSESDARLRFVLAENPGSGAITPALVMAQFAKTHDVLRTNLCGFEETDFEKLSARTAEGPAQDGLAWLEGIAEPSDPDDPEDAARVAKWRNLINVVRAELTDVKVIRFGEVNISTFLVGRTKNGDLAGFLTAQVET
ncbi:MAG: nuclease A inhibitor family protein [Myxococcaceae bacterium]